MFYICTNKDKQLKQNDMKTLVGITDNINTCECCGKNNLKKTFVVFDSELSMEFYYGSNCYRKQFDDGIKKKPYEYKEQCAKPIQEEYLKKIQDASFMGNQKRANELWQEMETKIATLNF